MDIPDDDLPPGHQSIDPTGGPQGPYFTTSFDIIDEDSDGLISWRQLVKHNPHVWLEDEKRVDYIEMFGSLHATITEDQMNQYITRIKSDLPHGSKYGRPHEHGSVDKHYRTDKWESQRAIDHRKTMPWWKKFNRDQGFINYEAMPVDILIELLHDQGLDSSGSRITLISRLKSARLRETWLAEKIFRDTDGKSYMNGEYQS